MITANLPFGEWATLGNNYIGNFAPGEVYQLDLAYSFYQDSSLNNIETVNLVYDNTLILQQMYDAHFEQVCLNTICENDCVWTGDANQDSIVNNCDILQIGLGFGEQGNSRNTPLVWAPYEGFNWGNNIDNIDLKHTDCSGDGSIDSLDFYWVEKHFNNSYNTIAPPDIFNSGSEIDLTYSGIDNSIDSIAPLDTWILRLKLTEPDSIYGLAVTLDYDTTYLESSAGGGSSIWENQDIPYYQFMEKVLDKGEYQYANVKIDGTNSLTVDNTFMTVIFQVKSTNLQFVETVIRVKNIKAILDDGTTLDYGAQSLLLTIQNTDGNGTITNLPFLDKNKIQLFPNPTTHLLNVKLENPQAAAFEVFDIYGKKVFEKAESFNSNFQLPMEHLSEGVYFLKVKMEGEEVIQKFIKM